MPLVVSSGGPMQIKYGTGTNKGKIRDRNEDSFAIIDCRDNHFMVFAVADGMGGMDFGDIASSIAIKGLEKAFSDCKDIVAADADFKKMLNEIFLGANLDIIKKCNEKKSVSGMGTTLSVCIMYGDKLCLGHIGDSRIYIFRNKETIQLTKDHSYVEDLIDSGRITREQARYHPNRNIITRALGLNNEIIVDIFEVDVRKGDKILLCTDGLTNEIKNDEIMKIVSENENPDKAVEILIERANECGGKDNVTVQLIYKEN